MPPMLEKLTKEDFSRHAGATFRLETSPGATVDVTLVETKDLSLGNEAASRRSPFSLLFRGPRSPVLPQHIYALDHPELGRLEIFLVPVREDRDGVEYEAIFN